MRTGQQRCLELIGHSGDLRGRACSEAVSEALGDVGVHAAPIEAKGPAADVNRAADTLTSRYDDPVL